MLKKMAVLTSAVQGLAAFFKNYIFFLIYTSVNTALTNGTWYLISQSWTVHITLLVICHGYVLGKQIQNWSQKWQQCQCFSIGIIVLSVSVSDINLYWRDTHGLLLVWCFILSGCLSNLTTCIFSATAPSECPLRAAWVSGSVMSDNCT